jgi:hypothetical protein
MNKTAQQHMHDPVFVANIIRHIIKVMVSRMSEEAQTRAYPNLENRINELNAGELASKKSPGGASIGASITVIKNVLGGRDAAFAHAVLTELRRGLKI